MKQDRYFDGHLCCVPFGASLLTLVAIVGGIIESGQRLYHIEVISHFQQVDLVFRSLFAFNYVDFYSKVLSKAFYVGQIVFMISTFTSSSNFIA